MTTESSVNNFLLVSPGPTTGLLLHYTGDHCRGTLHIYRSGVISTSPALILQALEIMCTGEGVWPEKVIISEPDVTGDTNEALVGIIVAEGVKAFAKKT